MIPILLTFIGLSTASMSVMFLLTRPRKAEKQLQERVMAVLAGPAAAASFFACEPASSGGFFLVFICASAGVGAPA